ncbi:MAG: phenylalanine--tRNA ligase subunit beta, partial [Verrucomicrobiota bacterium]|nr:phenylalanine--tRNA ligase subunit beta [Verrucomicrobiota bacterium]
MKISFDWMLEYVDLPDSPDELIEVLPMLGLEVEEDESSSPASLDQVVVGEVLSKDPHPEADRLSVCSVKIGAEETATIVCGATNFKPGDRVPVALPGAKLPGGFKIKKSKLRGVASEGMMCSAKELEIGTDADGLMILADNPEPGLPLDRLLSQDKTLELEITANRGDCLSFLGVAREIGAHYQSEIRIPAISTSGTPSSEIPENFPLREVSLETEGCSLYELWSIRGVKVGPSPEWLQKRLESVGLRPINNVVDATNFVLLETGQPLHAFDSAKISGKTI